MDDDMLDRLFGDATSPTQTYTLRRRPDIGGSALDVAALACLLVGAPVSEPSRRRSTRPLQPRVHFVPDKPLTKRQRRRLRGKARATTDQETTR